MLILVLVLKYCLRTNFKSLSLTLQVVLVNVLVLVLEGSVLASPVLEKSLLEDLKILNCSQTIK